MVQLLRGKKALAGLAPVPKGKSLRELPDLFNSLPHLSRQEAHEFLKDVAQAKRLLTKKKLRLVKRTQLKGKGGMKNGYTCS